MTVHVVVARWATEAKRALVNAVAAATAPLPPIPSYEWTKKWTLRWTIQWTL